MKYLTIALFSLILTINPYCHSLVQAQNIPVTEQSQSYTVKVDYHNIINNSGRPRGDLSKDKSRLPEKLLKFMQIAPGMTVFEQGASGGYTTELLARVVGPKGKVFAEGLESGRLYGNRLPQVKTLSRGLIFQIPQRATQAGLVMGQADSVVMMFTYHDLALNNRIDRGQFLDNLYQMLKSGGSLIIADNAAIEGSGLTYTRQTHRIDPQLVIKEITQAGFKLDAISDIYHNNNDDLKSHWRFLPKPRHHHRLLMRFKKP